MFFPPEYGIINNYLSLELFNKKITIYCENMEIYLSSDEIIDYHKINYPDSILSKGDYYDDCWCFLENLHMYFCNVKMVSLIIDIDNKGYFHSVGNFDIGDKSFLRK